MSDDGLTLRGWQYALIRTGNGKVASQVFPTPFLLEEGLKRMPHKNRYHIARRPVLVGDWQKWPTNEQILTPKEDA